MQQHPQPQAFLPRLQMPAPYPSPNPYQQQPQTTYFNTTDPHAPLFTASPVQFSSPGGFSHFPHPYHNPFLVNGAVPGGQQWLRSPPLQPQPHPMFRSTSSSSSTSSPSPQAQYNSYTPIFIPTNAQQLRSKLGHASTPSFVPPSSVRRPPPSPLLGLGSGAISPRLSRGPSPSISATGSAGFREREEKKRKVNVNLPWEFDGDELGVEIENPGRKKSIFGVRKPLVEMLEFALDLVGGRKVDHDEIDISTREFSEIEIRLVEGLESIDVYLPGMDGWAELRQMEVEERLQKLGYSDEILPPSPGHHLVPNSYIDSQHSHPPSPNGSSSAATAKGFPLPPQQQLHNRTGSLFTSRLQQAYDNRLGHFPSFSLGGASAFTKPFSLLPPLSTAPTWSPSFSNNNIQSGQVGGGGLSPGSLSSKPSRAELDRGFGFAALQAPPPKKQSSLLSTGTGVASLSEGELSGVDEAESDNEGLDQRQRMHARLASLETEAMGPSLNVKSGGGEGEKMVKEHRSIDPGYEGEEEDSGEEASSELGNEEDSVEEMEEEYSNPSDEDRARAKLHGGPPNPDNWIEGVEESIVPRGPGVTRDGGEGRVIFQAPIEVDHDHEESALPRTPRKPLPTPPRALPIPPSLTSSSIATSSSPPSVLSRTSLNVAAPEFVFGQRPPPLYTTLGPSNHSTTSLGSAGFGPLGGPGSLASNSVPGSPIKPNLNPFAGEFKPSFSFKLPPDAPTLVMPPTTPLAPTTPTHPEGRQPPQQVGNTYSKRQKVEVEDDGTWFETAKSSRSVLAPGEGQKPFTSPGKDSMKVFRFPSESPQRPPSSSTPPSQIAVPPPSSIRSESSVAPSSIITEERKKEETASFASVDCEAHDHSHDHSVELDLKEEEEEIEMTRTEKIGALDNPPVPAIYGTLGRSARPFTISASAAVSPEGRVVGFSPSSRRLPIPSFSNAEGGGSELPPVSRKSVDDINIPSQSRPRSQAIPIPPRRVVSSNNALRNIVENEWSVPTSEIDDEDVFAEADGLLHSPMSENRSDSGTAQSDDNLDDGDDEDSPLRILEAIIEKQFDSLRQDLSGYTSLKADLDSLKRDALVDSLASRMEELITTGRGEDDVLYKDILEKVQKSVYDVQVAVMGALKEAKPVVDPAELMETITVAMKKPEGTSEEYAQVLAKMDLLIAASEATAQKTVITTDIPPLSGIGLGVEELATQIVSNLRESLSSLLPPPMDESTLSARLSQDIRSLVVPRDLEEGELAPLSELILDHLKTLVDGHAKIDTRTTELVEAHTTTTTSRILALQDVFTSQLDAQTKLLSETAATATQIAELETQLAKARNDHGKVRSEKAVLAQRLEDDRLANSKELETLRFQIKEFEEKARRAEIDQALSQQTIERLEENVELSKAEIKELESKVASAKDQQDAWHATELQHIARIGENQVKARATEDDLARLKLELMETREENSVLLARVQEEAVAAAHLRGELAASEKRQTAQDEKLANLQRANSSKQQSIANANQKSAEAEKRNTELEKSRTEMAESLSDAETRLAQAEAASDHLRQEVDAYRAQMTADLEGMQVAVQEEQRQIQEELEGARVENERLQQRNLDLAMALDNATAVKSTTPNGYLPPPLGTIQRPQTAQPGLARRHPASPSNYPSRPATSSAYADENQIAAPLSRYGYDQPSFLEKQHTGSTVVRPSSTATSRSRSQKGPPVKRDDGWYE